MKQGILNILNSTKAKCINNHFFSNFNSLAAFYLLQSNKIMIKRLSFLIIGKLHRILSMQLISTQIRIRPSQTEVNNYYTWILKSNTLNSAEIQSIKSTDRQRLKMTMKDWHRPFLEYSTAKRVKRYRIMI